MNERVPDAVLGAQQLYYSLRARTSTTTHTTGRSNMTGAPSSTPVGRVR